MIRLACTYDADGELDGAYLDHGPQTEPQWLWTGLLPAGELTIAHPEPRPEGKRPPGQWRGASEMAAAFYDHLTAQHHVTPGGDSPDGDACLRAYRAQHAAALRQPGSLHETCRLFPS